MAIALRVFVSHSHEDDAFCQPVVTALRDAGADVWYDEHNLGSGNLMDVIMRELDRARSSSSSSRKPPSPRDGCSARPTGPMS